MRAATRDAKVETTENVSQGEDADQTQMLHIRKENEEEMKNDKAPEQEEQPKSRQKVRNNDTGGRTADVDVKLEKKRASQVCRLGIPQREVVCIVVPAAGDTTSHHG